MRQHIDLHPVIVDHRNDNQAYALPAPEWFDPTKVRIIRAKDLADGDLVLGDCEQPTGNGMYYAGYCLAAYTFDSTLHSLDGLNLNPDELLIVQPAATLPAAGHSTNASEPAWTDIQILTAHTGSATFAAQVPHGPADLDATLPQVRVRHIVMQAMLATVDPQMTTGADTAADCLIHASTRTEDGHVIVGEHADQWDCRWAGREAFDADFRHAIAARADGRDTLTSV